MSGRRRRGRAFLAFAAFGIAIGSVGSPANAQLRSLDLPENAGWQHAETGLVLLAQLAGYRRTSISDTGSAELDVIVEYSAPDQSTFVTLYLFRPALMSVPVWFDRSETQILLSEKYRSAKPSGEARAFAPPRSTVPSGLRNSYVTNSDAVGTTALAIMPMGEWLVKVRISSLDTNPAGINASIDTVIAAIGWPEGVEDAAPASLVADCDKPLKFARRAKLQRPSMTDALVGSLRSNVLSKAADDEAGADSLPVVFCRDAPGTAQYGVYRDAADRKRDSYLMAVVDSGRVISVAPGLGAILTGRKGYVLSFEDLDRTLIFPSFDRLATPDAALEAVNTIAPISVVARGPDGGSNIILGTDAE